MNRYAYAGNDPVNNSDRNGHAIADAYDPTKGLTDSERRDYHATSNALRELRETKRQAEIEKAATSLAADLKFDDPSWNNQRLKGVEQAVADLAVAKRNFMASGVTYDASGVLYGAATLATPIKGSRFGSAMPRTSVGPNLKIGPATGYTKHGINQAISREGVGVSPNAIKDALTNPVSARSKPNGTTQYVGKDATVVVNHTGNIVSTWARSRLGTR